MVQPRRTFTREFKVAAVKLITERGYSVAEAARSLGVHVNLLRRWRHRLEQESEPALLGPGHLPPLEEEVRRLRAENQRLRMERDILKKATAFFAAGAT
jgi:transposase